jgi:hypothetical protein
MGATSFLVVWVWTYLVGTFKYGRDEDEMKAENRKLAGMSINLRKYSFIFYDLASQASRAAVTCSKALTFRKEGIYF